MTDDEIMQAFEAFFEKYKKTEGDRSAWSAFWTDYGPGGSFEINMTKCPRGTVFKIFAQGKKLPEQVGWEAFFKALPDLEKDYSDLFDKQRFFSGLKDMV